MFLSLLDEMERKGENGFLFPLREMELLPII
jgi:hypothetical protein